MKFRSLGFLNASFHSIRLAPVVLLAGCSIAPLQQTVTGVRTEDLVNYIRCETRFAVQDKALDLMTEEEAPSAVLAELRELRRHGKPWRSNTRASLNAVERPIYDKYIDTGIALDFSFDITEANGVSGLADPVRLITNGTAGIGLSAGADYKRQNTRRFVVSDTAGVLIHNKNLNCAPDYRASNYAYPISGSIGMRELISTFFELNQTKELGIVEKDKPTTVFVDTLIFTTTLSGSVSPHVILSPVANNWGVAGPASIAAGASRIDKHQLIIGLSLDRPKGRAIAGAALIPGFTARSALQKDSVVSLTEQSALDAVSQARIDAYLDRATR